MPSSWNPPSTAVVGEPIGLDVEFCSPADTRTEHDVTIDGTPIISEAISSIAGQLCIGRGVGQFHTLTDESQFNNDSRFEASNGNLVVTEPGTYTLTFSDPQLQGSQTLTVEQPPIDPALVDVACPDVDAPTTVNPGDTVSLTARVSNGNSDAVAATVTFEFGGSTQQRSVPIPANGSAQAAASFTPQESGDFGYDTTVSSVSRA